MATIKKLYFANGTDVTMPADLSFESSTNHLEQYADDAAYVTANGAATEGDIYLNTTLEAPRAYLGGAWRTALMANDAADATKQVVVNLTGAAAAKAQTLTFVGTDNRSYTFPDYSGRIAINTGTETDPVLFSGATGNLDIGNASGTVRIVGNLEVQGTTTTLNTQTVQVEDNNIIVNYGGTDITAQGSGLQVDRTGTDGSLIYDSAAATKWKAGNLGSEVEIVDKSTAQALTNKTIDGSLNTISNLTSAMVTGTIAPSKGGTGVANNDAATLTRSGNHAVTLTTTNTTSVTLPTSGTLATLAGTEVLTNKDHDGGTASNASRFTVPKATKTVLDALTRKEATIVYGTDTKKLYVDYDSTLNEIGGGAGGAAGRNYLSAWYTSLNPVGTVVTGLTSTGNRTSSQTSWGSSATADLTIANNATLPLRETGDFLIDSGTSTSGAFVESPMFNLDLVDLSKAVTVSFDITGVAADGNYDVVVVRYNSSGTYQETISVAGNASSGSPASAKLPTGTTTFKGFFISSNTQTDFYSVRIRKTAAVNDDFQIDSLFVGPQSVLNGSTAPIKAVLSLNTGTSYANGAYTQLVYDTVYSNDGLTISSNNAVIAPRSGIMRVTGQARFSSNIIGLEINVRRNGVLVDNSGYAYSPDSQLVKILPEFNLQVSAGELISIHVFHTTGSALTAGISDQNFITFEMAGVSNVTTAERAVEEYASNSSATDADDTGTSNFVFSVSGSAGVLGATNLTDMRKKRIRFTTPILPTDKIEIEVSPDGIYWYPMIGYRDNSSSIYATPTLGIYNGTGTISSSGISYERISGSNTDIYVVFGRYQTNMPAYTNAWGGFTGHRFRVRKVSGGAAVGFPISPANITLINSSDNFSGNTRLGLMQYQHGTTYNGGIAPTVSSSAYSSTGGIISPTRCVFVPYQVADGSWRMKFNISYTVSGMTGGNNIFQFQINGITGKNIANYNQSVSASQINNQSGNSAYLITNTNNISIFTSNNPQNIAMTVSGDVELESKPTWAY